MCMCVCVDFHNYTTPNKTALSFIIFICHLYLPTVFTSVDSNKLICFSKKMVERHIKTIFTFQIEIPLNEAKQ